MKKYIKISGKEKEWIETALNVSRSMVDFALFFDAKRGNSDLAKRIRKLALSPWWRSDERTARI